MSDFKVAGKGVGRLRCLPLRHRRNPAALPRRGALLRLLRGAEQHRRQARHPGRRDRSRQRRRGYPARCAGVRRGARSRVEATAARDARAPVRAMSRPTRAGFEAEALPGVRAALEHLRAKGATLGIATGNLATIGRAKLEHTGLWEFFTVGGWSDEYETRADVFRNAVAKMRAAAGPTASICVLGDTPVDVAAARANGVPVIAVATGIYSADALLTSSPDLLLSSFEDLTLVS